ncbi:MAG: hypothetical protein HY902_05965 [Deltaproteobacteria bacterium]|nr:hypothetical protein [Deltaproteobacteria bacterium]
MDGGKVSFGASGRSGLQALLREEVANTQNVRGAKSKNKAWAGLAAKFGLAMKPAAVPMLVSVVRHLHFPMAPETEQMPPHFVSQTVRLRGVPA